MRASTDTAVQMRTNADAKKPTRARAAPGGLVQLQPRLFLDVAASKDAGDERQGVVGRGLVVSVVLDQPTLDDVDLVLRLLVDDVGHERAELDRVFLILEQ